MLIDMRGIILTSRVWLSEAKVKYRLQYSASKLSIGCMLMRTPIHRLYPLTYGENTNVIPPAFIVVVIVDIASVTVMPFPPLWHPGIIRESCSLGSCHQRPWRFRHCHPERRRDSSSFRLRCHRR